MAAPSQPLLDDDLLHIRVLVAECLEIDRGWDARDVRSPYWRFYVNSRDGASVTLADGIHPLRGGWIHLIPAWVRFSCRNRERITHLYAHFDPLGLPGALVRELFPRPLSFAPRPALAEATTALAAALAERSLNGPALLCQVKSVIYEALALGFAGLPAERLERLAGLAGGRDPLAPALQHIDDHLGEPLANAALARICGLSVDHFIRRFRAHVGQTPAQYVLERRVARAAQRLLFTNEPIEAIAESGGFPDRFYFSRVFARRMGMGPAAYRRNGKV